VTPGSSPLLPFAAFQFRFACEHPNGLPPYPGSAWRGALGWSLKRAVCVVRKTECPDCLLYRSCVFPYVFQTPPPPDSQKMRKYEAAPHPFVLRIEPRQHGTDYALGLILIGRAIRQFPYVVHALKEAGVQGIGSQRRRFELIEVLQATGPELHHWLRVYQPDQPLSPIEANAPAIPPVPEWLSLEIVTPLRIKRDQHLVTPARFRFADFLGSLLRRISLLSYFHTGQPFEADFSGLMARAATVKHHQPKLHWYDWTRYSSRQDTTLEMGGILGCIELSGPDIAEFWPLLWLGQWLHTGKGATLGLGGYRLHSASLPDQTLGRDSAILDDPT
jgi:hypothetical protein